MQVGPFEGGKFARASPRSEAHVPEAAEAALAGKPPLRGCPGCLRSLAPDARRTSTARPSTVFCERAFNIRIQCSLIRELFQHEIFDRWILWIGTIVLSLILRIYGIVSILNFETRCSKSAASLIQWWVQTVLFFFLDFF